MHVLKLDGDTKFCMAFVQNTMLFLSVYFLLLWFEQSFPVNCSCMQDLVDRIVALLYDEGSEFQSLYYSCCHLWTYGCAASTLFPLIVYFKVFIFE